MGQPSRIVLVSYASLPHCYDTGQLMDSQSPWNETTPPTAAQASVAGQETKAEKSGLPLFCRVIAIVDVSMGGFTLMGAPMSLVGYLMLPEEASLRNFVIPGILVALLVGGVSVLANIKMFYEKSAAVMLGYLNITATLIGVVYLWVVLPATLESQKLQLASDPNMAAMPPEMENMMMILAVGGNVLTTVVRLTLVVFLFIAIKKFKAFLAEQCS